MFDLRLGKVWALFLPSKNLIYRDLRRGGARAARCTASRGAGPPLKVALFF
jgi:hypothetical protein